MSAPTTHDPLVVATKSGVTWVRRAVVDGRGLYAVTDSCKCPEYLMATLAELAEHGIAGSADALPMPVAPERSELDQARDDVMGACLARWEEEQENARLRLALKSAQRGRRDLRARIAELEKREAVVAEFVAARAEYITSIRNCHPDNAHDYDRWQGHAAARRQLAELLGLPVAWPVEAPAPVVRAAEGEHYAAVHHSYRVPHDLPETGGTDPEERLLDGDDLKRAVRGHLFGGGAS